MANKIAGSPSNPHHVHGRAVRDSIRTLPRTALALGFLLLILVIIGIIFFSRAGRGSAPRVGVLETSDFHALAFSPENPNVVFFGHHNGILRSDDGGRTWVALVDRPNFDAMGIAVSRANAQQIYIAGHNVFQVSADGGASWQPVAHNLPGTDIHGFTISPDDSHHLYAFVAGQGGFQSTDSGRTWNSFSGSLPQDVMGLAATSGALPTLYASSMGQGVLRSTDGGQSWIRLANGPSNVFTLAVDPSARQTIYAGGDSGLTKSADSGATWSTLPFPADNVVTLAISSAQPNLLLAVAVSGQQGVVYRSTDGGQSWSRAQ